MATNLVELKSPPTDAISSIQYSPATPTRLLVSSWDLHVYLYDTHAEPDAQLIQSFEHRAPIIDVCFGENDDEAFTVGLDWDVRRVNLRTGEQTVLSTHSAPSAQVIYDRTNHTLISGSWDSTLHIHSTKSSPAHEPATLQLPAKPFALSASPTNLVVAMSTRQVHIYSLSALALLASQSSQPAPNNIDCAPLQTRESALKFMTRAVACMPSDAGFACSSIEGRVAVEWFDPSAESQARKYAFKCHRQAQEDVDEDGNPASMDMVYPVHALAFHPKYGTFASGGGDGVVALWDAVAKRRIRQYGKMGSSVARLSWSCDGRFLAVAVSLGFEDGVEEAENATEGTVKVLIREMGDGEAKPKVVK